MQRGAALSVDLGTDWDYWSDVDKPIATVRQRLGAREIAQPYDAQGRVKPGVVMNFAGRSAAVTDTPVMA